jgi:NTP pyrophosphatase (non-canonical NTP hydrolase)
VAENPSVERWSYLGLGLAAESGEIADHIKKLLRDDKLDRDALAGELGDAIYYWRVSA